MVFVDSFAGEGGSTAAAATRDSVANESRKKMGKMVWQGPRLGFVAETGRFVAMGTSRVRFSCLLLCLASYFSFFLSLLTFSLHPGMLIFLVSLRLCSSHLPLSASMFFIARVLSVLFNLYPTPSRISLVFYSFSFFFFS